MYARLAAASRAGGSLPGAIRDDRLRGADGNEARARAVRAVLAGEECGKHGLESSVHGW